jgi:hypothetical protein
MFSCLASLPAYNWLSFLHCLLYLSCPFMPISCLTYLACLTCMIRLSCLAYLTCLTYLSCVS